MLMSLTYSFYIYILYLTNDMAQIMTCSKPMSTFKAVYNQFEWNVKALFRAIIAINGCKWPLIMADTNHKKEMESNIECIFWNTIKCCISSPGQVTIAQPNSRMTVQ